MSWYWWIILGILGLNAFVVVVIGLFLIWDRCRSGGEQAARTESSGKSDGKRSGR
jgi:hypothetical protein